MNATHQNQNDLDIDSSIASRTSIADCPPFRILVISFCIFFCSLQNFSQTSKFVEANGLKTHYLEWGKGKNTIVLIHGLTDTAEIWQDLASILAKNYRVIAPDRRGSGKSEKPSDGYDSQTLAADVDKFLNALNIKKATIVGHSFGGITALALAADFPARVNTLILIEGGFWQKREPVPLPECPAPVNGDCLISRQLQRGANEFDGDKLYSKIRAPALLILGLPNELNKPVLNEAEKENRKFFDEAASRVTYTASTQLKRSRALVIQNAQHWVFVDQPEIVAEAIDKFINEN
jgi:pimeloyl-ACP methyl ester carboxylesterase